VCVCVCVFVCECVCAHACVLCVCVSVCVYLWGWACLCTPGRGVCTIYTHVDIHIYEDAQIHVYIHMYTQVYTNTLLHTHIYSLTIPNTITQSASQSLISMCAMAHFYLSVILERQLAPEFTIWNDYGVATISRLLQIKSLFCRM